MVWRNSLNVLPRSELTATARHFPRWPESETFLPDGTPNYAIDVPEPMYVRARYADRRAMFGDKPVFEKVSSLPAEHYTERRLHLRISLCCSVMCSAIPP